MLTEAITLPLVVACIVGFVSGYFLNNEAKKMQEVDAKIEALNQQSVHVKPEQLIVRPMSLFVVNYNTGVSGLVNEDIRKFAHVAL